MVCRYSRFGECLNDIERFYKETGDDLWRPVSCLKHLRVMDEPSSLMHEFAGLSDYDVF